MSTETGDRTELLGIQYLRAIGALAVIYYHTGVNTSIFYWPQSVSREFVGGAVDIFFVISGFIIVFVTYGKDITPRQFLPRRLIRMIPIYWTLNVAIIIGGSLAPALMYNNGIRWDHIGLSFLFIPHWNPFDGTTQPFYKLGWTLNYEIYFYLLSAASLLIRPMWKRMLALVLFGAFHATLFVFYAPTSPLLLVWSNPLMLEFIMGSLIGWAAASGALSKYATPAAGVGMILAGLAPMLMITAWKQDIWRPLLWGVPAALIVAGILVLESFNRLPNVRWLHYLGQASFSIYLVHTIGLSFFRVGARIAHLPYEDHLIGPFLVLLAFFATMGLGVMTYEFVELPLVAFLRSRLLDEARIQEAVKPSPA
jgi:peptidoglycan/LPS O-acetylase OafA/YrhL